MQHLHLGVFLHPSADLHLGGFLPNVGKKVTGKKVTEKKSQIWVGKKVTGKKVTNIFFFLLFVRNGHFYF